MSTLNERLKEVRKMLQYNQLDFAAELGISRTHVSNMENANDNPSASLIKLICMRFNINEEWLTSGVGSSALGWGSDTHEGLIARYNTIRVQFEQKMRSLAIVDLLSVVESFAYLDSLVCAIQLEGLAKTAYLHSILCTIDEFERLIFTARRFDEHCPKRSMNRYLPKYQDELNVKINMIAEHAKDAANIYLAKYDESAKL